MNQKSIQKWSPRWNASRHRFLMDFGGFSVPSWGGKSSPNGLKTALSKRCKKEGQRDGQKVGKRRCGSTRNPRPRPLGRSPPNSQVNPSPPRAETPLGFLSCPSLFVLSGLVRSCQVLSCQVLSGLVLSCLGSYWVGFPSQLGSQIHQNPLKIDARTHSTVDSIF